MSSRYRQIQVALLDCLEFLKNERDYGAGRRHPGIEERIEALIRQGYDALGNLTVADEARIRAEASGVRQR
jgi:hypothetical protein